MIQPVMKEFIDFCQKAPKLIYAWVIILNKLARILADPFHRDSWVDIVGYASLVVDYIDATTPGEATLKNPPTI